MAVADGRCERALVPIENSLEGSVNATLDALVFETDEVQIVGEVVHPITHTLIAKTQLPLERIERVLSHPQASAQCARFLRERLSDAEVMGAPVHRGRRADRGRERAAVGRARQSHLGAAVRLRGAGGRRRGHTRERDPLRLARAEPATAANRPVADGRALIQDLDRLLGTARPPGRAGRRPAGVRRPARSTSARSSRGRASRASAATCSSPTSKVTPTIRPWWRRSARSGRRSRRCACSAATRAPEKRLQWSGYTFRNAVEAATARVTPAGPTGQGRETDRECEPAGDPAGVTAGAPRRADGGRVLVLNASYEPLNVCTVRRAVVLVLKEKAELVEQSERRRALRERHAAPPGRDPAGDLRARAARPAPPAHHPPRRLRARLLDLPVLRHRVPPDRRPRDPPQPGRPQRLGEHRHLMRAVQPPQGQPHAGRERHARHAKRHARPGPPSSSASPRPSSRRPGSSTCCSG